MGLALIAAALRLDGHLVKILDQAVIAGFDRLLHRTARRFAPDLAGFCVHTPTLKQSLYQAGRIKALRPDCRVVLGGYHPSLFPEECLSSDAVDWIVRGAGEQAMRDLAEHMAGRLPLEDVENLWWRENGKVMHGPQRHVPPDLDALPTPAWDLFPLQRYRTRVEGKLCVEVAAGRGCPEECLFCGRGPAEEKRYQPRSPHVVVSEMQTLINRFGLRAFFFTDANMTADRDHLEHLCHRILEADLNAIWYAKIRADRIDRPLLDLMVRAGCREVYMGAESGSDKVLARARKGFDTGRMLHAVRLCKEADLKVYVSFILGFPWDTHETIHETLRFAADLEADDKIFFPAIPFPGSALFDIYKKTHRGPLPPWEDFCMKKPPGKPYPLFFEPEGITRAELNRSLVKANLVYQHGRRHFGHWTKMVAPLLMHPVEGFKLHRLRTLVRVLGIRPLVRRLRGL